MNQSKDAVFSAIVYLFRFLFIAFLVFGIFAAGKYPLLVRILGIIFIIWGPLSFMFGMLMINRYKSIHDYEPVELLGHKSDGKQVRTFLQGLGTTGVMFFVAGLILFFISSV